MQGTLFLLILGVQCSFVFCHQYEYYFIEDGKTWKEAQAYCRGHYSDLATVSDMEDMNKLKSVKCLEEKQEAWIGLYSVPGKENRHWHWSQPGVAFGFTDWGNTEPNDRGTMENCVFWRQRKWLDTRCDAEKYFICYDAKKKTNASDGFIPINEEMNWSKAQRHCRENHTDLASGQIEIKGLQSDRKGHWIGLFRDTWNWSDSSNSSFRSWRHEEFQDGVSKKECATVSAKPYWGSDDCEEKKPFFCYDDTMILIQEKLTWEDALNYCRKNHGDLVSVTNPHIQKSVEAKAKKASTPFVWIGLSYICALDLWFWVSDELLCYENWRSRDQENDECGYAGAMETEKWVGKYNREKFNFICTLK